MKVLRKRPARGLPSEIGEGTAIEYGEEPIERLGENAPQAAYRNDGTSIGFEFETLHKTEAWFHCPQHLSQIDGGRVGREFYSAAPAFRHFHETVGRQRLHHPHQMISRNAVSFADLPCRHITAGILRQIKQNP